MFLAKLYSKDSNNMEPVTFEKVPPSYLMKNDKLYSMVNNQLVSDEGYKATFCYVCVNYQVLR